MPSNASVERFRLLTEAMKKDVHNAAVAELHNVANDLRDQIKSVAPVFSGPLLEESTHPGALKESVRTLPSNKDTIVRVVAGGAMTTDASGKPYDYARAVEFGTQKMAPHPFFFPTYRLMKSRMIAKMKRRIAATIKDYSAGT